MKEEKMKLENIGIGKLIFIIGFLAVYGFLWKELLTNGTGISSTMKIILYILLGLMPFLSWGIVTGGGKPTKK